MSPRTVFRCVLALSLLFAFAGFARLGRAQGASPSGALVPNGTHFLVRLSDELNSGKDHANRKFQARTLEPLAASNGMVIPPGAKLRGHISRIEPGGVTGHARLWLTFDEMDTHMGRLPIVAFVSSVPGEFSVKPTSKEGEIEARSSESTADLKAAATGAALGAAHSVAAHNGRDAAAAAMQGGAAAYVSSSGLGQELDLKKGTKIDLVLDRPLYLN
jgi:hypothetical protein